tara:strand:- start:108 stop:383 length:276 start_codon:yes stop_codon:yes gene_type:complete
MKPGEQIMFVISDAKTREKHDGMALGFTEEWLRSEIQERVKDQNCPARIVAEITDDAFDQVLDRWEDLVDQPIIDLIDAEIEEAFAYWSMR